MYHTWQNIPAAALRYKLAIRRMASWRFISAANFSSFSRGTALILQLMFVLTGFASFIGYHYRLDEGNSVLCWHSWFRGWKETTCTFSCQLFIAISLGISTY